MRSQDEESENVLGFLGGVGDCCSCSFVAVISYPDRNHVKEEGFALTHISWGRPGGRITSYSTEITWKYVVLCSVERHLM